MSASKKSALLVIDIQQSFTARDYWNEQELPDFACKVSELIAGAVARNVPVVQIFHVDEEGPFSLASGLVQPLAFLPERHEARFYKSSHNAFTSTGLQRWLTERGIGRVVVCGIRTEQCCETTARVACDLGFEVDFVTEATLTFAMTHANGRVFSSAELRERTELVLSDRFARIMSVASCLAGLDPQ